MHDLFEHYVNIASKERDTPADQSFFVYFFLKLFSLRAFRRGRPVLRLRAGAHGWKDAWIDGWIDECMAGWMDAWMDGWMDRWIDKLMDGWVNG